MGEGHIEGAEQAERSFSGNSILKSNLSAAQSLGSVLDSMSSKHLSDSLSQGRYCCDVTP